MTIRDSSYILVGVPVLQLGPLTYLAPADGTLTVGDWVRVPVGRQITPGIVLGLDVMPPAGVECKAIQEKIDLPSVSTSFLDFLTWAATYTLFPLGAFLKMALPKDVFEKLPLPEETPSQSSGLISTIPFNSEQNEILEHLLPRVQTHEFSVTVVEGVTGSGKTEVYFQAIDACLKQGKTALVLLPEIALTDGLFERFEKRFGVAPLVWHSALSKKQRRILWKTVIHNEARVVLGARSALFLPLKNMGLVVVDEEHDGSYKQDTAPFYQARDLAVVRAKKENAPIFLCSATPSIETIANAQQGKYHHVKLSQRYGAASLPEVMLVDLRQKDRKESGWVSPTLLAELRSVVAQKEQALVFLNRRGYAPLVLCHACGHRYMCPACSVCLVEHRNLNKMQCHQCGYQRRIPTHCEQCQEEGALSSCGPGVERVYEELKEKLPEAHLLLLSSDTLTTLKKTQEAFDLIERGEIDIMVGTQLMAKGHHFPNLTLVGVIDGDLSLQGGDMRAGERTYQMIHQVGGRSGRAEKPGRVLIQTHMPEHIVMQSLKTHDFERFLDVEITQRREFEFPPFGHMVAAIVSGTHEIRLEEWVHRLAKKLPQHKTIEVFGPAKAPLYKRARQFRWRFLFRSTNLNQLREYVQAWRDHNPLPSTIRLTLDVNPYSFL